MVLVHLNGTFRIAPSFMNNLGSSVAPEAKIPHGYFKTSGSGRHILFDFRRLVFVLNMKHAAIH